MKLTKIFRITALSIAVGSNVALASCKKNDDASKETGSKKDVFVKELNEIRSEIEKKYKTWRTWAENEKTEVLKSTYDIDKVRKYNDHYRQKDDTAKRIRTYSNHNFDSKVAEGGVGLGWGNLIADGDKQPTDADYYVSDVKYFNTEVKYDFKRDNISGKRFLEIGTMGKDGTSAANLKAAEDIKLNRLIAREYIEREQRVAERFWSAFESLHAPLIQLRADSFGTWRNIYEDKTFWSAATFGFGALTTAVNYVIFDDAEKGKNPFTGDLKNLILSYFDKVNKDMPDVLRELVTNEKISATSGDPILTEIAGLEKNDFKEKIVKIFEDSFIKSSDLKNEKVRKYLSDLVPAILQIDNNLYNKALSYSAENYYKKETIGGQNYQVAYYAHVLNRGNKMLKAIANDKVADVVKLIYDSEAQYKAPRDSLWHSLMQWSDIDSTNPLNINFDKTVTDGKPNFKSHWNWNDTARTVGIQQWIIPSLTYEHWFKAFVNSIEANAPSTPNIATMKKMYEYEKRPESASDTTQRVIEREKYADIYLEALLARIEDMQGETIGGLNSSDKDELTQRVGNMINDYKIFPGNTVSFPTIAADNYAKNALANKWNEKIKKSMTDKEYNIAFATDSGVNGNNVFYLTDWMLKEVENFRSNHQNNLTFISDSVNTALSSASADTNGQGFAIFQDFIEILWTWMNLQFWAAGMDTVNANVLQLSFLGLFFNSINAPL